MGEEFRHLADQLTELASEIRQRASEKGFTGRLGEKLKTYEQLTFEEYASVLNRLSDDDREELGRLLKKMLEG